MDGALHCSSDAIDVSYVDSTPLELKDLFDVQSELISVSAKWKSIGFALRLDPNTIDSIQDKNNSDPSICLTSVVAEWLKRNYIPKTRREPTWRWLVEAVGDPAGGANMALARDIGKHKAKVTDQVDKVLSTVDDTPLVVSASTPQSTKQAVFGNQEDSSASKPTSDDGFTSKGASVSPGPSSSSPREESQGIRSPTSVSTTSSFPYLSVFTSEEQKRLRIRLCVESEDIVRKFWHLHSRVYESLCERKVSVDKLVTHLLSLHAFDPVYKDSQKPALQAFFQDLQNAGSIEKVFYIIRDYISFYNYHVIEHIVNVLGTDQDRVELQNYKKEFDEYSKRRVYECPPEYGSKSSAGHVDLVLKVDSVYEDFTVKELDKFEYRLSRIFCVSPQSVLRLCQVEEGCLQLIFQIPSFVQQVIFPLSSEQEKALAAEGVIRLTCADYQFTAKGDENEPEPEDTRSKMKNWPRSPWENQLMEVEEMSEKEEIIKGENKIADEADDDQDAQKELQPSEFQSSTAQEDDWKKGEPSEIILTEVTATQNRWRKGEKSEEEPKSKPNKQEPHPSHNQLCYMGLHDEVNQAITPTVGQLFKQTVEKFPIHPALKYKEGGIWKTITYTGYYDLCIKAAKSFLKSLRLAPRYPASTPVINKFTQNMDIQLGLEPPNHAVAIIGANSPEWVISALGAMFVGGLPTGIYTTNGPEACHFVANSSQANIIVVENAKQLDKILQIRDRLPHLKAIVQCKGELSQEYPNVYEWKEFLKLGDEISTSAVAEKIESQKPNHCAVLIYTSGTTDAPEGVMLSHENLIFSARALVQTYGRLKYGRERGVSYLPLSHIAAQMADIYLPLLVGATVYFAQPDALSGLLGETIREAQPTFFFGVPRVYERMMEHLQEHGSSISGFKRVISTWAKKKGLKGNENRQKNQSLPLGWTFAKQMVFKKVREALGFQQCKIFAVGAAPIQRDVHDYFMSINIPLMELYGLSECTGCHTLNLRHNRNGWRVGSCGKPINGVELKIVDPDDNKEIKEGEEGEICIYGPHVFMGYFNNEDKTSEAIDDDGWLHSRDLGKLQDGFLYITGRMKEVITTSSGEKIPPVSIEDRIKREIEFLSNVMVVGHKRSFLACLVTLKCEMDQDTEKPLDILTTQAHQLIQTLGSHNTRISEIIAQEDRAVFTAIQKGLDRVNERATSQSHKIQKWTLLSSDFSIPGGELGPTLKVRRHVVQKKYETTIEDMYSESSTLDQSDVQKSDSDFSIPRGELETLPSLEHPTAEECPVGESQVELTICDLAEVTDYLLDLQHNDIYNLGLILGLYYPHLSKMETSKRFRDDVIAAWLQKEDQVLKMGIPTWETLVKALRHPRVNQTGLANKIEDDTLMYSWL